MIVTVGGIKGGVGKSLISTNLTVIRSLKGKVLLVDGDEQGTSGDWVDHRIGLGIETTWTTIRLKGGAVRTEVLKLVDNYDDILIDCGGRDTSSLRAALTVADVFLVPFQPKSFDIWTISKVTALVEEVKILNPKLITYCFINCGGTRGSDNVDAMNILSAAEGLEPLYITIALRKAFSNATAEGMGIIETKGDIKAIAEMNALHNAIFENTETFLKYQNRVPMKSNISHNNRLMI